MTNSFLSHALLAWCMHRDTPQSKNLAYKIQQWNDIFAECPWRMLFTSQIDVSAPTLTGFISYHFSSIF
jgi:hypothetical protein